MASVIERGAPRVLAGHERFMKPHLAGLMFGVLFLTFGLLALIGSWGAHFYDSSIQETGGRAVGHVIGKRIAEAADGDSDFYVDYSFALANGPILTASHGVSKGYWDGVQVGQSIDACYDQSIPNAISRPVAATPRGSLPSSYRHWAEHSWPLPFCCASPPAKGGGLMGNPSVNGTGWERRSGIASGGGGRLPCSLCP